MMRQKDGTALRLAATAREGQLPLWRGPHEAISFDETVIFAALHDGTQPCTLVCQGEKLGVVTAPALPANGSGSGQPLQLVAQLPALTPAHLGSRTFCDTYGVRYAYAAGAMAGGIAATDLVIAMGQAGLLSSFGAAGLLPQRIEAAIAQIQQALPNGPYAFNLIHSPSEEALEREAVALYLKHGVHVVEASAFLDLTPHIVHYRVAGLRAAADGSVQIGNRVIAKLSRQEVATKFMRPAPARLLQGLLAQGLISETQAQLAAQVPMADDVTVEADSGGHTDNRPLVSLLPSILVLRDEIQAEQQYVTPIRVGAAGGISTPASALAAFMLGADYVVAGSVNQSCVEAGTSAHAKSLLAQADTADVMLAPAADMFEMGVRVQVLKRGTLFGMRAQKLYELYRDYESIDDIPDKVRAQIETQIFKRPLTEIWQETTAFFQERDPEQLVRAANNPKRKMALIFRWYLGLSSRWANSGDPERQLDYQIWCGPSMGAFNDWVRGSYLEAPENRRVSEVAHHMMHGAAYLYRLQQLRLAGVQVVGENGRYQPQPLPPAPSESRPSFSQPATEPVANQQGDNSESMTKTATIPTAEIGRDEDNVEVIQAWLVQHIATRLAVAPDDIDLREPFSNYDMDSTQVLVLATEMEKWLQMRLSPTLLWNYPTIAALAERLAEDTAHLGKLQLPDASEE